MFLLNSLDEYPDLTDDDSIADEVLAQYSGQRGYKRLMDETKGQEDMSVLDKLAEALARFWKAVADFLHIHYTSKEQVADQVLHDLLTGVNPLEYADKMVDQRETESFKEWFGDWEKSRLLSQVDLEKMQEAFDDIKNNLPQKSKEARKIYDDFAFDMGTKYGFDWLEQLTDEEREEEHNLLNYREYYDLEENDINELRKQADKLYADASALASELTACRTAAARRKYQKPGSTERCL